MFKPGFVIKLFLPVVAVLVGLSLSFSEVASFLLKQVLELSQFSFQVSCRAVLSLQRIAASSECLTLMFVAVQLLLTVADLLAVLIKSAS